MEPVADVLAIAEPPTEIRAENVPYVSLLFHPGIVLLWDSYRLAEDLLGGDRAGTVWDVALDIQRLRGQGMNETQLRWLVLKGYVACKHELLSEHAETNWSASRLRFDDGTLLMLTKSGFGIMQRLSQVLGEGRLSAGPETHANGDGPWLPQRPVPAMLPHWDAALRELWLGSSLVKQYKGRADNQALVLSAFQEEKWTIRIDDPLPPRPRLDAKLRLRDTISSLNRHQFTPKIRFHGDGTGRGVRWEPIEHRGGV